MTIATVIFELVGVSIHFDLVTLLYLIFSCAQFLLLCMKGGSCTSMPLTSTLTLHPPFEKFGYGPVIQLQNFLLHFTHIKKLA